MRGINLARNLHVLANNTNICFSKRVLHNLSKVHRQIFMLPGRDISSCQMFPYEPHNIITHYAFFLLYPSQRLIQEKGCGNKTLQYIANIKAA